LTGDGKMNENLYQGINIKQDAKILFFPRSIFLYFSFKNTAKRRKRKEWDELVSVTALLEDTNREAGSPDDVPGHSPGRDMAVGRGPGCWPRRSTQGHLIGADKVSSQSWARLPHN